MFLNREDLEKIGFKKIGNNVLISDKASIYRPDAIEIGNNVRIDDFCILSPGDNGIYIGNYIHIGCQSTLIGKGRITLEDFSNISSKVSIYSSNDDYSGDYMTNPMVPSKYTNVISDNVTIKKHTIIGANSVILPGVTIGECCSIGSLSLVKKDIEDGWIVAGSPAKKIRKRSLELKNLERNLNEENIPLLSVAISSYKFAKYIEECVNSISNQITNFKFEIVIRDDYSMDGTSEILDRISKKDSRIKILKSTHNVGVFENIKIILENCKGKYVSLLDGDDYITDIHKLQCQVNFLEANPDFILHSTGYRFIDKDGIIGPYDGKSLIPIKEIVIMEDMLNSNIVTFGRTFRNIPGIMRDWMKDLKFLDWAFNFEILKYGKAKCDDWCSGIYRISGDGMITSLSEKSIIEENEFTKKILLNQYNNNKTVAIVDSFVHNEKVEKSLSDCIDRLSSDNIDILLVSNTKVNKNIADKATHYLYDGRNQLFEKEYTGVRDVDLWTNTDVFESHKISPGLQRHGLSVLINIFNSLELAKSLGYKYFYRFEVDDEFGLESRNFIKSVPKLCIDSDKKALFYYNEGGHEPNNISFHFIYSEIDYFLNKIPKIKSEDDFRNFLMDYNGNMDFMIAEEYVYNNLKRNNDDLVLKKSGSDMNKDFIDTEWNKITSESNMSEKFKGCTTLLYNDKNSNNVVILSQGYKDKNFKRKIEVIFNDKSSDIINHDIYGSGSWVYNIFDNNIEKIKVSENDEFLYEEENKNIKNYIIFR